MAASSSSRLCRLRDLGQSVWLDDIDRPMLNDGALEALIEQDCVAGLTSNPVIFERALRQSDAYDADIARLAANGADLETAYEALIEDDIRRAADLFRPTYDATERGDGYVSIEVSPHLARDTEATVAEATRLWKAIDRPNLMIKVPGTEEGLPAIRALIARGINVNVTLLFSPERYGDAAEAYLAGLEERISENAAEPPPHSVASFFLSRIDTLVDKALDQSGGNEALRGATAIALARVAYGYFAELGASPRWRALAAQGAAPQRLLWASTGTKDPAYSDVKYVEPLIGADTVNTLPRQTLAAFRDHGNAAPTLVGDTVDQLNELAESLARHGIDLEAALLQLEQEGVDKFNEAFDKLHEALAQKLESA